jgi:bilirubin oxidase
MRTYQTYNPLVIPNTLTGTTFNLALNQTNKIFQTYSTSASQTLGLNPSTTLGPAPGTTTLGYNGALMWGPTLIMNQGDTVQINVCNNLNQSNSTLLRETSTTVHWHGFHIPAIMDGGPRQVIAGGGTWSPTFTVKNNAATYWYHPHLHIATQEQLTLGAGGFIIVRDPLESALALPRTYGVDDIPLAVTTRRFLSTSNEFSDFQYVQADGSTSNTDNYGDYVLVNGTMNPQVSLPAQYVRLRILNADIQRGYRFGFSDNRNFYVIGNDQGLLNAPVQVSQVTMMIGERVEILVDLGKDALGNPAVPGTTTVDLMAYNNLGTAGAPGGADFGFAGSESNTRTPNGNSGPENGGLLCNSNFTVLHINVAATTANPITSVPATLANNTYWTNANVTNTRAVNITGGNGTTPGFTFNNIAYSPTVFNFTIPLNAVEKWVISGGGVFGHSLHIHDVKFNVIARNLQTVGNSTQIVNTTSSSGVNSTTSTNGLAATYESGWKDTVYVPNKETVTVIAQFGDFASNTDPYMFHCHMLDHEDGGLMGRFSVVNNATENLAIASFTRTGGNSQISMYFNATVGTNYNLQYSTDLSNWTNIATVVSNGTSAEFTETDSTRLGQPKGFYRVVIPSVVTPPVITSSLTATVTHGTSFSYQIAATNSPTSYSAVLSSTNAGLPGGLTVNTNTGVISGTPTTASTCNIVIIATNAGGSTHATLVLTVN